jgi:hypothetical protein
MKQEALSGQRLFRFEGLEEKVNSPAQSHHQVENGATFELVTLDRSVVFQLFALVDKALLFRGDPLAFLQLFFDGYYFIGGFHIYLFLFAG